MLEDLKLSLISYLQESELLGLFVAYFEVVSEFYASREAQGDFSVSENFQLLQSTDIGDSLWKY